jgi:Protein of unknown function (DUF3108)
MAGRLIGRGSVMGYRVLAVALALALIGHMLSLSWLQEHMASIAGDANGLQRMAKPMFTRQIALQTPEPTAAPTPATAPVIKQKRPIARINTAQAAIKKEAEAKPEESLQPQPSTPEPSPTLAQTQAEAATTSLAPTPTLVPTPVTDASTTTLAPATSTTASTTTVSADPLSRWPLDTRLSYALSGNFRGPLNGTGTVQWQRQGERYQTSVDLDLGPLRIYHMLSQGRVTPDGLVPQAFEEKRMSGKQRVVRLQEDSVLLDNGSRMPRPSDLQDTASQFVALTYQFTIGTRRLGVGEVLRYHLARPGGVDEWVFDVVAEDTLYTARWGPVQAFHLKPRPLANPRGNIYAEIWFAPSLQYLPARIRITEGEVVVDLLVSNIVQADAKAAAQAAANESAPNQAAAPVTAPTPAAPASQPAQATQ